MSKNKKVMHDSWYKIIESLLNNADVRINGERPFDIQVHNNLFYKRVLQQGSIGLGESYMEGWWDCDKLDEMISRIIRADLEGMLRKNLKDLLRVAGSKLLNMQSKKRAWIVGKEHYDLGNNLFTLMLDPYMQYSCGYWRTASDLHSAQQSKLKLICDKLQLKKGMTLLDIGCGWGGLAAYAAENYGVKVTGVTISAEQLQIAKVRCASLDVDIKLLDYRDLPKESKLYDRVVSVGMFEHVGVKNYCTFFETVDQVLKENGLFLLHTIGSNKTDLNVDPWIDKYIFPNGSLPSISQIAIASESWFVIEDLHNFGVDYDKTLMSWEQRFNFSWYKLDDCYSPKFKRMFNYYLKSCAGAFRARKIQLWQFMMSKGISGGLTVMR